LISHKNNRGDRYPIESRFKPSSKPVQTLFKPNSKPVQTLFKPNSKPVQTLFKPNSKPVQRCSNRIQSRFKRRSAVPLVCPWLCPKKL